MRSESEIREAAAWLESCALTLQERGSRLHMDIQALKWVLGEPCQLGTLIDGYLARRCTCRPEVTP